MSAINVDSAVELYTTTLGWLQYESMWFVLLKTGIVFVPFLGMIFEVVMEPMTQMFAGEASITSLRRLEVRFIMAMIVIALAAQPSIPLKTNELVFSPICNPISGEKITKNITTDNDQSVFVKTTFLANSREVRVPVWWYAVMSFSSGLNTALKNSLPCEADRRQKFIETKESIIKDPLLFDDLGRFYEQCYQKARATGAVGERKKTIEALIQIEKDRNFSEWMGWLPYVGTEDFKRTGVGVRDKGFYDFHNSRDELALVDGSSGEDKKIISCRVWWAGASRTGQSFFQSNAQGARVPYIGLFDRLVENYKFANTCAQVDINDCFNKEIDKEELKKTEDERLEILIKGWFNYNLLENSKLFPNQVEESSNSVASGKQDLNDEITFFNSIIQLFTHFPTIQVVRESFPAVQALILLGFYALLPFGIVFSTYSYQFLVQAAVGLLTVRLFGYVFFLASWIENKLLSSITTASHALALDSQVQNHYTILMSLVYFFGPLMVITVFGWAGFAASGITEALDKLGGRNSNIGAAAEMGGSLARKAIEGAAGSVAGKVGKKLGRAMQGGGE